ncbi:hypothetical protein I7I50_08058 [Histoplasma capsulatum G186AR]|uniref:Uncharacterized protein n=1 Tax=Ajellomyces capsulatus TaxID=5037 RepID=A0A8H7YGY9_AJECA|nr:hypothetical protein I7I52_08574 [Histoplasma capsulatum]QSS68595.1 hypothetical protein I7I50_08058 [Histoplasma capsulatum G186AR]
MLHISHPCLRHLRADSSYIRNSGNLNGTREALCKRITSLTPFPIPRLREWIHGSMQGTEFRPGKHGK